jgi:hypothetical protein
MNWLREHAYLATWLGPAATIIVAIIQNRHKGFAEVDWSRILLYVAFLTSLAVVFTPTFDETARKFAKFLVYALLGFLIVERKPR